MKKEIFNILFLGIVVLAVAWLYWPAQKDRIQKDANPSKGYILALTWQPAFCEGRPNKPECRSQRKGRYDTQNFALHGLWPQPRENVYCGVSEQIIETDKRGGWARLPKLELSAKLRNSLSKYMPGYRSNLHRHEWYKHGTCMGDEVTAQEYFERSISLLKKINDGLLRNLFSDSIGREVNAQKIVNAMEKSHGKGAGKRIAVSCKRDGRRTLISEVRISVLINTQSPVIGFENGFINNAPTLSMGCKRGIVDPVGLQ